MDDPTEQEIKGAADKLATMISSSQPSASVFYHPHNLGALPHLWLQAKLTISLTSVQEKFARLFMTIASELWLRGVIEKVEEVFAHAARSFTLRLAETLSKYICSLTRRAESLATPETECLLYATWFRPILSGAHCGSQRECRGQSETRSQRPCQSCSHEPAPLAASHGGRLG